ncbi:ATP-binding cassette domain-containing protein [Collinsella tanakaei]|uniref:ATP-binding cassette domain-containing protein n=1 Tax=Collinsella tanakaei TaxID=626935 RepID=UPI0029431070|nr:ATP-binding cassette domain-containing protein [Collinsella tanakaei]
MTVHVRNVTKTIKGVKVLDDISIDIPSGSVTGLRGINGSGKTMLMRAVCGLIGLDDGSIEVDGKRVGVDVDSPPSVGLLIENPGFIDGFSGFDNLWLLAQLTGRIGSREVESALELVGLKSARDKAYRTYSLGMKQRLGIAAAIMESPDLVVLDEPTNALDESGVALIQDIVHAQADRGAAVLVASHDAAVLSSLADRIYELYEGRIKGEVCCEST